MAEKKKPLSREDKVICANLRRIWDAKKQEMGLSQQKAADFLGVTQGAVSHQLKGRNALHTDAIISWAELLGCGPTDIDPNRKYFPDHDTYEVDRKISEILKELDPAKRRTGLAILAALRDQKDD